MAKRKNELTEKLDVEQPSGWRDQVGRGASQPQTAKDTTKAGQYLRKTYLITPELVDRIKTLADRELVGQNELVRYLLTFALDQIDSGAHTLPTQPVQQRTLGV